MKCGHVNEIHRGAFATVAFCTACNEFDVIAVHKGTAARPVVERKNVPKEKPSGFSTISLYAQLQARAAQQQATNHVPAPLAKDSPKQ